MAATPPVRRWGGRPLKPLKLTGLPPCGVQGLLMARTPAVQRRFDDTWRSLDSNLSRRLGAIAPAVHADSALSTGIKADKVSLQRGLCPIIAPEGSCVAPSIACRCRCRNRDQR